MRMENEQWNGNEEHILLEMAENIAFVAQEQFGSIVSVSQSFTEHEI